MIDLVYSIRRNIELGDRCGVGGITRFVGEFGRPCETIDQLSGSVDSMRMELLILQETGLSLKFHSVGLVYTHGYYERFFYICACWI